MGWNIAVFRNVFLKLKSNIALHRFVLRTPRTSHEKLATAVVEMQQLPDIEKDTTEEFSCLKWTMCCGRKVFVNFKPDRDKLNIFFTVTETSCNSKENENDLKLTQYQKLLIKRLYLLSCIDVLFNKSIALEEKLSYLKQFSSTIDVLSIEQFPTLLGSKIVVCTE